MQHSLSAGPLLNAKGELNEAGYATSLVKTYDRSAIKAGKTRIKEWDYYLIYNGRFGAALTIDDNSYMGMISASFLDFEAQKEKTVSPMFWFPMGKTNFPASSKAGDVEKAMKGASASIQHENGGRRLICHLDKFDGDTPFDLDIFLFDEPRDSMVIATPFAEQKTAFYYNQKIIGMRAHGTVKCYGKTFTFEPEDSFGLLDWGRGVWTHENTWYWGGGHGVVDGHVVGFNIGYGFGDVTAASENMIFIDGIAHKLDRLTFNIPLKDGKDDFMSPWTFTSSDGRFETAFTPVLDRAAYASVGPLLSDQHQVFGYMDGTLVLDDGSKITLKHFLAFAEKVHNKW
ncbi:MAG TPA: DUF2804 domain-containing protein [Candidatus Cryosericum sp.]|nr:DUF2804 domain-containing protein [Candidatus Cryosericum sp.]